MVGCSFLLRAFLGLHEASPTQLGRLVVGSGFRI